MDKGTFSRDVLGGTVPQDLVNRIFKVFAGGEELHWKDFVCSMVVFLKV